MYSVDNEAILQANSLKLVNDLSVILSQLFFLIWIFKYYSLLKKWIKYKIYISLNY